MKKKIISVILALTTVAAILPLAVLPALAVNNDFCTVAAGTGHTMAIKTDGSLWGWGWNIYGALGDGTYESKSAPVKIMDNVAAVYAGAHVTMAIKTDGSLWAWGDFYYIFDMPMSNKPVKLMDDVVAASVWDYKYAAAVKADGSLIVWQSKNITKSTENPIKVMDNVSDVSVGFDHVLAIKTDGSLWALGSNYYGQLGIGLFTGYDNEYTSTPVKVMDDVALVSAGAFCSVAVKTDGSLWAWGNNDFGQLGDGTRTTYIYTYLGNNVAEYDYDEDNNKYSPVKVMDDVVDVSSTGYHTMAIKSDGSLWAWGDNRFGQYGNGTRSVGYREDDRPFNIVYTEYNDSLVPLRIMDGIAGVSLSNGRTMILKTNGSLYGCGWNGYAVSSGDMTDTNYISPVKVMDDILLPGQKPPVTASPTLSTVLVNGNSASLDAYNINDNNYFKLRDLAYILSGSDKQFDVSWDAATNTIYLTRGLSYTPVGGEMGSKGSDTRPASSTTSAIYLDDVQIELKAYNIAGNNYFKLRDIGQALDFGVTWDGSANAIIIDTSLGYTSE